MIKEELTQNWNRIFPNQLPIAHELKHKFSNRWLRFHTLSDSKRYAENENEYKEILRRHNLVLSDLFGESRDLVLLTVGYGANENGFDKDEKLDKLNLQKNFWISIDVSDENDYESYFWNIFFDEFEFKIDSSNNLFKLVADDEISDLMIFSIANNIVYHPYDGGADIIFQDSNQRDKYKNKYRDWLSKHPEGF